MEWPRELRLEFFEILRVFIFFSGVVVEESEIIGSSCADEFVSDEHCVISEEDDSGARDVIVNPFLVRVRVSLFFRSVFVEF